MDQSINDIKAALKLILKPQYVQVSTPFIWGLPGIGKSSLVKQLAKEFSSLYNREYQVIDFRFSQIEHSDLKGIPQINEVKRTSGNSGRVLSWIVPEDLPSEDNPLFEGTSGILFLDEWNRGNVNVQQAGFQLVNDRCVGKHKILDSWFIIAAGNYGYKDKTDVTEMDSALKNRFCHFHAKYTTEEWVSWAKAENVHQDVISFINIYPEKLYVEVDGNDEALSLITPRSWERFSSILNQNPDIDPIDITSLLGQSIIGTNAAYFEKFLRTRNDISAKEILFKYATVCERLKSFSRDSIQAINGSIIKYIINNYNKWDEEHLNIAIENYYLYSVECLEKDLAVSFHRSTINDCRKADPNIKFLTQFLEKHPDMISLSIKTLDKVKS